MSLSAENAFSPKKCETTKNGLAFEVILDNPKSSLTPAKLTPHNTPNRQITNEDIKTKLQKAEERRQSLEMMKLSQITEKMQKKLKRLPKFVKSKMLILSSKPNKNSCPKWNQTKKIELN